MAICGDEPDCGEVGDDGWPARLLIDPAGDVALDLPLDGLAAVGRGATGDGSVREIPVSGRDGSLVARMKKRVAAAASSRRRTVSARERNFIVRRWKRDGGADGGNGTSSREPYLDI